MTTAVARATDAAPPVRVRRGCWLLWAMLLVFFAVLAAPILGLVGLALAPAAPGLGLSWNAATAATLTETLTLLAGVGALSATIGVGAAWIVAMHRFPGRDALAVMLVLPLALPTYLAAYVAVELTDYFGPLQTAMRALFGFRSRQDYWFFDLRSMSGAIVVLSLVLYPYVYLPARLMFERQASRIIYAARLHGARGFRLFFRIGLPLARPALAGGVAFALLETLNDIGAVEHFGIQSLSLAVRALWLNRGNLPGAAQIALLSLVLVTAILMAEYGLRRHSFAGSARAGAAFAPRRLGRGIGFLAMAICAVPVLLGFVAPAIFLGLEAARVLAKGDIGPDLVPALRNSLAFSTIAATLVGIGGACVALAARLLPGRLAPLAPRIATLGYAIPGSVLVIALLPVYGLTDDVLERLGAPFLVSGSMGAIILAYIVRFTGIGIAQAEAALMRLSRNIDHAAQTLGAGINRIAFGILAPNIWRGIGLAVLFAFVDTMKELPATLLLRPLNTETLATSLYAHASSGTFENGAIEAILLFGIGLLPVAILARAR